MKDRRYTVVVLSSDSEFSDRIARILEPVASILVLRAASIEQANDLIRETVATSFDTVTAIVATRPDGLRMQAALLADRHGEGAAKPSLLVLSPMIEDDDLVQILAAGIEGFLPDHSSDDAIRIAVRSIAHEMSVLPRGAQRRIGRLLAERIETTKPESLLTPREKEILGWMVGGHSNSEIAHSLHLSEGTVKTHVKAILQKTGSRNRTEAAMRALRRGIIER